MKRFVLYIILFFLPIILLLIPFFVSDPFKCIYSYATYSEWGKPMLININRTYVSTEMYEQYRDIYHWNSFIFGSSRSGYYRVEDWKKHLPASAICYHFDGYGESIYNIYHKMKYIDGKSPMDNVLICLDDQVLYVDHNENDQLHCTAPRLTSEVSRLDYCVTCLRAYLQPVFLKSYLIYWVTDSVFPYMEKDLIFDTKPYYCDIATNQTGLGVDWPDSVLYTAERVARYPDRTKSQTYLSFSVINETQLQMLWEIREILERNESSYKIVLNPCYQQVKICTEDSIQLREIFGDHLYDCSGINRWTNDIHNYVDPAHFRSSVAAEVMDYIYD